MFNKLISWILNSKFWRWLVRKVLSGWTFRIYGWPSFKGSNYWNIKQAIEKSIQTKGEGIFVFCSVDKKLASYKLNHILTKCIYSHAGLVFIDPKHPKKEGELSVKHITTRGFVVEPLQDILGRADNLYIGRMPLSDLDEAKRRLELIEKLVQKPHSNFDYDYSLTLEQELIDLVVATSNSSIYPRMLDSVRLYCSEFIYLLGLNLVTDEMFTTRWVGGRYIFEPDAVYRGTESLFKV